MRREYLVDRLQSALVRDWPRLDDLEAQRVTVDEATLRRVEGILRTFRHCVLTGAEGRGKTSLARVFGYNQTQRARSVFVVDMAEPGGETMDQLCAAIRNFDHVQPTYILENVHAVDDEVEVAELLRATVGTSSSYFLYTSRAAAKDTLFREIDLAVGGRSVTAGDLEVKVEPSLALIRRIVAKYVRSKPGLALPADSEYPSILTKCGQNLRTLSAYLEVWETGRFDEIRESEMLSLLYNRRLAPMQASSRLALVRVSGVAQFGVSVLGEPFDVGEAELLAAQGILNRHYVGIQAYYSLPHPTDAKTNVAAWASVNNQDPSQVTHDCLLRYLTFEPLPSNALSLLQRLRIRPALLRQLLANQLVSDLFITSFGTAIDVAPVSYIRRSLEIAREAPQLQGQLARLVMDRGPTFLAEKVRAADEEHASWALREFTKVSRAYGTAVRDRVSADDWHQIWLRTPLPKLIRFLYRYAADPAVHDHTAQAQAVLAELVRASDFSDRIRRLSYELVGKLLLLFRRIDEGAGGAAADAVAEHLDLVGCKEPMALTLILKELWQLDASRARDRLLLRILDEMALDIFVEEKSGRALAFLLFNCAYAAPDAVPKERGQMLLRAAMSSDIAQRVRDWDPVALQTFLWAGLLIDSGEVHRLVRHLNTGCVADVLLRSGSPMEMFQILWNVLQADPESARSIASVIQAPVTERFWRGVTEVQVQALPLLGLLLFLDPEMRIEAVLPEPAGAAATLCRDPGASSLLFALRAYEVLAPAGASVFAESTAAGLMAKGIRSTQEFFTAHPVETGRQILRGMAASFGVFQVGDAQ